MPFTAVRKLVDCLAANPVALSGDVSYAGLILGLRAGTRGDIVCLR